MILPFKANFFILLNLSFWHVTVRFSSEKTTFSDWLKGGSSPTSSAVSFTGSSDVWFTDSSGVSFTDSSPSLKEFLSECSRFSFDEMSSSILSSSDSELSWELESENRFVTVLLAEA